MLDRLHAVRMKKQASAPSSEALINRDGVKQDSDACGGEISVQPANPPGPPPPPPKTYGMTIVSLPQVKYDRPNIIEYPEQSGLINYDIYLYGDIGCWDGIFEADVVNILTYAKEGTKIRFFISSCGGSLFAAAKICAALLTTKATTYMTAAGCCASAAALIWCYGKNQTVEPGGYLMFHMSSHGDWGNSESIRMTAEDLVNYVKEICIEPAVKLGVLTEEDAEDLLERRLDIWLDADEVNSRLSNRGSEHAV